MVSMDVDFSATCSALIEHNQRFNEAAKIAPHSYLLGDAGVLLFQFKSSRSLRVAHAFLALVQSNLYNATQEFLRGSPGTLLAALHMFEMTNGRAGRTFFNAALTSCGRRCVLLQMRAKCGCGRKICMDVSANI